MGVKQALKLNKLSGSLRLFMQLTRYTDYGLRTLIYLALLPQGRRASIDEISTTYDISRNNVNKIVHQLGKAGIIETKRGKGGGFYLKQKPEELNIGDLVVLLENTLQVVECKTPQCRILPACKLKGILGQATQAFLDSLKAYTLADLLEDEANNLIQILNI
jgi:Rrf2 family nitric oxide-sensitive transcriptional repressor